MQHATFRVDNAAHLLYFGGRAFPCDREIVSFHPWNTHALLLSADTDCLSLWDADGLIRTARAGVCPQDMAVWQETALVCGGNDGKLHALALPSLRTAVEFDLPGIPQRLLLHNESAWVLSLLPEDEAGTALLQVSLKTADVRQIRQLTGIPGTLAADQTGLWVGTSGQALHLPFHTSSPDMIVEGIGLPERIEVYERGIALIDGLDGRKIFVRT